MKRYRVTKRSYWAEKGQAPILRANGDLYESSTLSEEDKPSWLVEIGTKKKKEPRQQPAAEESSSLEITYPEMVAFVKKNKIVTVDSKKSTLIDAINEFNNKPGPEPVKEVVEEVVKSGSVKDPARDLGGDKVATDKPEEAEVGITVE